MLKVFMQWETVTLGKAHLRIISIYNDYQIVENQLLEKKIVKLAIE